MRKIGPALPGAAFIVIGWGCCAATHKLAGDMPPQSRVRKRINYFADSGGEPP